MIENGQLKFKRKRKGRSMSSPTHNGSGSSPGLSIIIACNVTSYVTRRSNDVKGKLKLIVFRYPAVTKDSDALDLGFRDISSGLIDQTRIRFKISECGVHYAAYQTD